MSQLYSRVFVKILDSSIAEDFTLRHIFEDLLKLADHRTGTIDMTRSAIARRLNVPIDLLNEKLNILESPDENSNDPELGGCRIVRLDEHRDWGWKIVNWHKYESLKNRSDVAERVARHRQKKAPQDKNQTALPLDPPPEKKDPESEEKKPDPEKKVVLNAEHKAFIDGWGLNFIAVHGFSYVFDGGKDGRAVKELLAMGIPRLDLLEIAKQAWEIGSQPYAKHCKMASTIWGFRKAFNDIRVEVKNATAKPNAQSSKQRVDRSVGTTNEGTAHLFAGLGKVAGS